MRSNSAPVGRVRERPPHEGAEFGCGMGQREIFLWTVVTFPDSCVTADYQVFLPLCPGGFVCFLHLFVCFSISLLHSPASGLLNLFVR